jgi:hypothetical protein
MITKHAVVLAIILGAPSGSLVTNNQYGIGPTHDLYSGERSPAQSNTGQAAAASVILVQGRCYNGHCY